MSIISKHLIIDATSATGRLTGIERYTRETTKRLIGSADERNIRITILLAKNTVWYSHKGNNSKVKILYSPYTSRLLTEQIWIPAIIYRLKPSHCFFPAFPPSPMVFGKKNCKIVKTVHDAVMWKLPQTLPWKNKLYMKPLETFGIHRYDQIFTVSEHALKELSELFPATKGKIINASNGIDYNNFNIEFTEEHVAAFRKKHSLPDRFLLFIGTLEPRKNLLFLLEVLVQLHTLNHNVKLVIAGRFGWGSNEIHNYITKNDIQDHVQLLGAVPDDDLPALYKLSTVFVFPSLYEGFGLPVIEAMAAGTPVIASNTSSIPEAGGAAAMLISPTDKDAWSDAIVKIFSDYTLRQKMKEEGFRHALKFDWNNVAKRIIRSI